MTLPTPARRPTIHPPRRSLGGAIAWGLGLIIVLAVTAALAALFGSRGDTSSFGSGSSAVQDTYKVQKTSFDMIIPASGELEALNSIEVRNQVESQVVITWIIEEGKQVKAGDTLVELSSEQITSELEEERLRLNQANSELVTAETAVQLQISENQSTYDKGQLRVTLAQLELERWRKGEDVSKRKDLDVAIEKATTNLDRSQREYNDSVALEAEGFISKSELQDDEIQLLEARNALDKARLDKTVYEEYAYPKDEKSKLSDLEEANAELARILQRNDNQMSQRTADLDRRKREVFDRQGRVERMEAQLTACSIKAPSDGLVVYGTSIGGGRMWGQNETLQIGQQVWQNQLLIILPDTSQIVAAVKVHETQSSQVHPDMPAVVTIDALPNLRLTGKVKSVGVLAEQSGFSQVREYSIKILIEETNSWGLKPSMRAKAELRLGRVDDVIAVPLQAIFTDKQKHFAWVRDGRKFTRREIVPGRMSETFIEVISGLSVGDFVLLREPLPGETA